MKKVMQQIHSIVLVLLMAVFFIPSCRGNGTGSGEPSAAGPGGIMIGMTREQVSQVMLDDLQVLQMTGKARNPYALEFLKGFDGNTLEVMYYYVMMEKGDNIVTEEELVPVILENGIIIGWGWDLLGKLTGRRPVAILLTGNP